MPDRSVPVVLNGTTYHLRFTRADIKAVENTLGVGYLHFVRPGIFGSLTATEAYLWRGLYQESKGGTLQHVFEQTDAGKELAGELFWSHRSGGGADIDGDIVEAFITCGLFKRKEPDAKEETVKNLSA